MAPPAPGARRRRLPRHRPRPARLRAPRPRRATSTTTASRHLTDDLLGLLDETGHEQAVFVGHDWGALIVWDLARLHPERVRAVVGVSVPFVQWPAPPTELMKMMFTATASSTSSTSSRSGRPRPSSSADPYRTMATVLWGASGEGFARRDTSSTELPPMEGTGLPHHHAGRRRPLPWSWLTEDDLQVYADEFAQRASSGRSATTATSTPTTSSSGLPAERSHDAQLLHRRRHTTWCSSWTRRAVERMAHRAARLPRPRCSPAPATGPSRKRRTRSTTRCSASSTGSISSRARAGARRGISDQVVGAGAVPQVDVGRRGQQAAARLGHLDHRRRVEVGPLRLRRVPLLDDEVATGSWSPTRRGRCCGSRLHAGEHDVLRQHGRAAPPGRRHRSAS